MMRPLLALALSAGLTLGAAPGRATEAELEGAPAAPTSQEAQSPKASLTSMLRRVVRKISGRDSELVRWIRSELGAARTYVRRREGRMALRHIRPVRQHLEGLQDHRYRAIAERLWGVAEAIRYNDFREADQRLDRVLRSLDELGGGSQYEVRRVARELREALELLRRNQPYYAADGLARTARSMQRSRVPVLRREADSVQRAQRWASEGRARRAGAVVERVLDALRNGGGGGSNPSDPDRPNRAEWRRDIRDLVDTIRDGNLRMAHRDLQTLMRDIRNDGYDWNRNRQYVQRLQFIGQNLRRGNERWVIDQLRELSRDLDF